MVDIRRSVRSIDKSKRAWFAALAGAFVIGILVGWLLGASDSDSGAGSPDIACVTPPASRVHVRSEEGAVAAATTYARIMAGSTGDDDEYRNAMQELAAPGWGERAAELADNALAFVEERYGPGGRVTFNPVRYRVLTYTNEEARIDIWGVVLGVGPKLGGIEESWVTATLSLVWVDESWRVQGQSSQGGPTPELLRTQGQAAVPEAVEGFQEYDDAPQP